MKSCAIIPAKTQSRRFPGKNMAHLNGVPLLAHAIDFSLSHDLLPLVFTDGEEVKRMAEWYGARVYPQTPEQFEGYEALLPAIEKESPDALVLVQCTNPFHRPGMLEEMLEKVEKGETASIYTSEEVKMNGHLAGNYRKAIERTEENTFHRYDGGLIVTTPTFFLAQGNYFLGQESSYLPNSFPFTWDIDYPEDLVFAEYIQRIYEPIDLAGRQEKYLRYIRSHRDEVASHNAREMEVKIDGREEGCRYLHIPEKRLLMPLSYVRGYTIFYLNQVGDDEMRAMTIMGERYTLLHSGEVWKAIKEGEKTEETQVIECVHPRWRRRLVINPLLRTGYVEKTGEGFSINDFIPFKVLDVKWDNWGREEFLYRDGVYYKD